jgi:hypothetical protein
LNPVRSTFSNLLFLLACTYTGAQADKISFTKDSVAEGLPEETVNEMLLDEQGFLWLDPATDTIPVEIVGNFALLVESAGDIWFSRHCPVKRRR